MSFRLYRDAGVPAPRTAYARVFVTVPGKHERKYFGLYSLVENVDKNFVADRGLGKGGAIFKPSMPDLFADLGDDWAAYEQSYDPKTDLDRRPRSVASSSSAGSSRKASDEEFAARLGDFIDLDEFARFLAVTAWIGDLDSILTTGQNYYLFLDPKSGRFQFIPWDKDHTFGSWIGGDHGGARAAQHPRALGGPEAVPGAGLQGRGVPRALPRGDGEARRGAGPARADRGLREGGRGGHPAGREGGVRPEALSLRCGRRGQAAPGRPPRASGSRRRRC